MSSTRRKLQCTPMRQERFASSQDYERGLIGSIVAKRCSVLDHAEDRELIWWLQFLSHCEGGLRCFVQDLLITNQAQIGTAALQRIGKNSGSFTPSEMRLIIRDIPGHTNCNPFPLKGERSEALRSLRKRVSALRLAARLGDIDPNTFADDEQELARETAIVESYPESYSVADVMEYLQQAAEVGLESFIKELCLNPALSLDDSPWYFQNLVPTLRKLMRDWIEEREEKTVVTSLGKRICDVLDYTAHSKTLSLIEGDARIGKSFAARSWCEQHPGSARFIEVPTGNDDTGFFRALARGLGLGALQQYKAVQLRERVESVILTGDILLCLDEAHRLWPEGNIRYSGPKRINWLMSMANAGVPICMVSTPQFMQQQKAIEKHGWNSAQLIGRTGHYEPLPRDLSKDDLIAVAESLLPESDSTTREALASYARISSRYLAAIESIAKRARYIATKAGRDTATTADVQKAMKESVIPADSKLAEAIAPKASGRPPRSPRLDSTVDREPAPDSSRGATPRRGEISSAPTVTPQRSTGLDLLTH